MMLILYTLIAIFIAWIWVDYYRLIDIYESEHLKYFIITFFLGAASVGVVLAMQSLFLDELPFKLNGGFLNDLLYSVFRIGMVEEFAKTLPFFIMLLLFRDQFNEPIDYLAYISISALGFSAAENVQYFNAHGSNIIIGRAILSTVGHMFDTSLVAYGFIRYKYMHKRNRNFLLLMYFFLAALAHGFYDFWLINDAAQPYGWIITIIFFFICISLFAEILNNALNNSGFFTYRKIIDSGKVAKRLLKYYALVYVVEFALVFWEKGLENAVYDMRDSLYISGIVIVVSCVRLSRFKLIKDRWNPLRPELPFTLTSNADILQGNMMRIGIKGESYNEVYINRYYETYFYLNPLSPRNTYIVYTRIAFIERKVFLKNDETFYVARVYAGDLSGSFETLLLKPKTMNETMVGDDFPIVALLKSDDPAEMDDVNCGISDFQFLEWAYIKPKETDADQ